MSENMCITELTWTVVGDLSACPEKGKEVLVYDSHLDDIFFAYLIERDGLLEWIDVATGGKLPCPQYYTGKPFPVVTK